MRVCSKCETQNEDSATRCRVCMEPLQQSGGKTCPAGKHTMDPTWSDCVYCRQENASTPIPPARPATVFEGAMPAGSTPRPNRPQTFREDILTPRPVSGPPTPPRGVADPRFPEQRAQQERPRQSTIYRPVAGSSPESAPPAPSVAKDRKIVGILVTYSWTPEGQIFPVREGRNLIGRDKDCDICVPDDQTMSGRNSHITFRQNFVIGDLVSMTGTDVDGTPIEEQFKPLANYAAVRAGSTYFTFIVIQPAPASGS